MKTNFFIPSILILILSANLTLAIGVTPPRLIIENALKGHEIEQSVKLIGIEEGSEINVEISGKGSEWIKLRGGNNFTFSKETEELEFLFQIPPEAPNGEYNVKAIVLANPLEKSKGGTNTASVVSGIVVDLNFTVSGEENQNYFIRKIFIPNYEVNTPLTVILDIENDGNVLAIPKEVELTVKDKESKEELWNDKVKPQGEIKPFSPGESIATFYPELEEGFYFGDIKVDIGSEIIEEKNIPFNVFPEDYLNSKGKITKLSVQDNVQDLAKITATFKNEGENGINTAITLDIYRKDSLIASEKTEPQYVKKGLEREFIHLYEVEKSGEYTVKAYAEYNGKKTNEKEISFTANTSQSLFLNPLAIIVLSAIALMVVYAGYVKLKNKRMEDVF